MKEKDSEFRKRLLSTFTIEALDHIRAISSGLVELEKMPPPAVQIELVEIVYREFHSLKGAARAVNIQDIEVICQSVEDIFSLWKLGQITPSQGFFDILHGAIGVINLIMSSAEVDLPSTGKLRVTKALEELSKLRSGTAPASKAPEAGESKTQGSHVLPEAYEFHRRDFHSPDTVRISASKLSALLLQAEEMLTMKLSAKRQFMKVRDIAALTEGLKNTFADIHYGSLPALKGHQGADLKDALVSLEDRIREIENNVAALRESSVKHNRSIEKMVDNLLEDMKKAMMLPFSTLLETFPMLIRDISHGQGKEAELVIKGGAVEIDRRVLEEMKDPLIHIIRNCVDHGIEKLDVRADSKKNLRGVITLAVSLLEGNKAEILVSDDGKGIDVNKVKKAAVKCGALTQGEAAVLDDRQALSLIFRSGVSTSPIITDLSGRGLGLAIVREKIENLGGNVDVNTAPGSGTSFRIVLPLTASTFRGVRVRASDQVFIIPTSYIERTLRVADEEIKKVENKDTIAQGDRPISYVRLENVLELPLRQKSGVRNKFSQALVLNAGGARIAFGVDEVAEEQDVMVKSLGKQLPRVRNIAGAAIGGSGKPVPILNVSDLMRSATKAPDSASQGPVQEERKKAILIAEDSITSRVLLKNILESAGYEVKTAMDGVEAITMLKTGDFDLAISDVDMPRMNGFDLTQKIRADKRLSDLPVILVTALETREHRERGVAAGANAYIIKSDFNQSNLLDCVKRLI